MRYLNIQTYQQGDKELGADWFPETDERISPWFNTPMGYDVEAVLGDFPLVVALEPILSDGTVNTHKRAILDKVVKDVDGKFFSKYETTPDANGLYQPNADEIASDAVIKLFTHLQSVTDQFIQVEVNKYNITNKTTYQNIDSFTKYTFDNTKARYAVAIIFLDWSDAVWDKVVIIRDKFLSDKIAPTDEEFIAQLPTKP